MKIIPAKFHGVLDYAVAATLAAGPLLFGFKGVALILAIAGGLGLFAYSLVTDYSVSARRLLPFRAHLAIDFAAALILAAAPFVFGFSLVATIFYTVIGVSVIAVVLVTDPNEEEPAIA